MIDDKIVIETHRIHRSACRKSNTSHRANKREHLLRIQREMTCANLFPRFPRYRGRSIGLHRFNFPFKNALFEMSRWNQTPKREKLYYLARPYFAFNSSISFSLFSTSAVLFALHVKTETGIQTESPGNTAPPGTDHRRWNQTSVLRHPSHRRCLHIQQRPFLVFPSFPHYMISTEYLYKAPTLESDGCLHICQIYHRFLRS